MDSPTTPKPSMTKSANVDTVVQEYMDSLLVDLFPDVASDIDQTIETPVALEPKPVVESQPKAVETAAVAGAIDNTTLKVELPTVATPLSELGTGTPKSDTEAAAQTNSQTLDEPKPTPKELRYPKAPDWAQGTFEVLLFDVCGLKLAVPMEALGKIIKVEHETNQLIGRPDWFIGAYIDSEQHLYVVDTAKYIMPEKGFNLAEDGFDYVIQLQRSKWSLACKKVHSTVSIEPGQVKWRSQQGKRQWLSGTVVDHMCALLHVDSLIALLESQVK